MYKPITQKPELIAFTLRRDNIETMHQGWICVLNQDKKIIYQKGKPLDKIFLRSAEKPIQATPIIDNNLNILQKELALATGSHSGSKMHIKVLKTFMRKNGLHLSDLKCGILYPFDEKEKNRLLIKNENPSPLHNNCSGKHLGMLAVCKKNKWDTKNYLNYNHPLQKLILKNIEKLSETKNISIGTDGCGAPTHSLPLINIAKMFSNFTHPDNSKYFRIVSAMRDNPIYVGGQKQIDTEIMKLSGDKFISKVGAEGIIIVAWGGNCAVVKIADGLQRIRSIVILKLLIKIGWLKEKEILNSVLEDTLAGYVKNNSGKVVGKIVVKL